jgi:hypothetical protein
MSGPGEKIQAARLPVHVREARSTGCKHADHHLCSGYYGGHDLFLCQCPCHDEARGWEPL